MMCMIMKLAHTCSPTLPLSWQCNILVTNSNQPQAMYIYYLILYYEHKALCMCAHETAHTCSPTLPLSWQHNILVTNSNQPQAMYTCYLMSIKLKHCVCAHVVQHYHYHGSVYSSILVTYSNQPQAMTT